MYSEENKYSRLPTERSTLTISQLIRRFQEHFEGEEHRRNMLRERNKVNLRDMFHKNPSREKGLMFNEIVQILRLDGEYQTDSALRNKLYQLAVIFQPVAQIFCNKPIPLVLFATIFMLP
ncbi:putative glycosyl transferase [Erysiphe neolycopersici]|uniref:Putative glycosyl transferase n=1 Tax=Erysiphe neolycopersici TaxID=212602 RepID=A0A420I3Y3_9PEZI|nr:putative glycosyl transferase [Erysiphe neolycopersici]